jgi:hypothetical protein
VTGFLQRVPLVLAFRQVAASTPSQETNGAGPQLAMFRTPDTEPDEPAASQPRVGPAEWRRWRPGPWPTPAERDHPAAAGAGAGEVIEGVVGLAPHIH